ncbi:MAG: ATP-binding protein [Chthoniobacteraceae bacterium]
MNLKTDNSSQSRATQGACSPVGGRMMFYAMLFLLAINATGFSVVLFALPAASTTLVVLLILVFLASALPLAVIGWLFCRMINSANTVSQATGSLATGPLTDMSAALQAWSTGDIEHTFQQPVPSAITARSHGEIAGLIENFNKLQQTVEGAFPAVTTLHEVLRAAHAELWQANDLLQAEQASRLQAVEELRNLQRQLETQAGEGTDRLSQVKERLEKELAEHQSALDAIQRWEQVFKNLGLGMATINSSSDTLLAVNTAFAEMHGYHSQELIGQSLEKLVAPESQPDLAAHAKNAGQKKNYTYESTHIRRDGTSFPVLATSIPVMDANGAVLYRAVNFQDVGDRRKVEESLKLAKEEAEKAIRARTQFLSRMSHELRTPLNVILGFSQLLEMNLADPEHHDSVQHILKAGKHLLSLINEVLDISRIEADKLSLSLQVVPVGEAMLSAMALVRPMALQRHIEFVDQLNSRGVKHVIADNQRLQQVFLNLLSNAVKYNKANGRVTVWCSERADNKLAVSVTDTGSGIPAEKLSQLFTPFERLGADEVGIEGTGLGLALSKRLVELMDGTLEVSSIPGEGSTFSVALPMASSPVQKLGRLADERLTSGEKSALSATCKLLYIEEDMSNVRLVEKLLKPYHKIGLIFAQDGWQGLAIAGKQLPDMILLDLDFPDAEGEKVLQKLREQPETEQIPVVVISADTKPKRIEQMLRLGASHYLVKPIDVNKLLVVIGENIKIKENLTL